MTFVGSPLDTGEEKVHNVRSREGMVFSRQRKGRCSMKKYVCKICGWVYDPAENNNVAFEDLPADWTCPACGVGKDNFEPAFN